jgi:flagellar protein FliS
MYNTAQQDYLAARVMSADPISLVRLLFDGLEDAIGAARRALHEGDIRSRSKAITKGVEILGELLASLNRESGGEISIHLEKVYEYMIWRLTEANIQQTEAPLAEVQRIAGSLADAWREISGSAESVGSPTVTSSSGCYEAVSVMG